MQNHGLKVTGRGTREHKGYRTERDPLVTPVCGYGNRHRGTAKPMSNMKATMVRYNRSWEAFKSLGSEMAVVGMAVVGMALPQNIYWLVASVV